jgi:hypothetical protein
MTAQHSGIRMHVSATTYEMHHLPPCNCPSLSLPPPLLFCTCSLSGSLAACCAEVESRTRIDPRNGRPMPEQANVKVDCLAYKKPQATGTSGTPAAAPAAPNAPAPYVSTEAGKLCYGIETDKQVRVVFSVETKRASVILGRRGQVIDCKMFQAPGTLQFTVGGSYCGSHWPGRHPRLS